MAIVDYAISVVQQFLERKLDPPAFAQQLGGIYIYAKDHGDEADKELANALMAPHAQFSGGHVSDAYLREELANTIRPFVVYKNTTTVLRLPPMRSWVLSRSASSGSSGELIGAAVS